MAVIVPMYNEKHLVLDTLRALENQRFDQPVHRDVLGGFRVILVDNNSTDDTAAIVSDYISAGTEVPFEMITELEKGTGSAADAGARRAIELGATCIARTDADTLPAPDWLASIIAPLLSGRRLVGGRVRAITGPDGIALAPNAIVYTSLRRLDEYGAQGFVSWYASSDRTATEQNTDIR